MFATSTNTATFLLTMTPWSVGRRPAGACSQHGWRSMVLASARGGPLHGDGAIHERTRFLEPAALPAGPLRGVRQPARLDDGAGLVPGRSEDVFEKSVGHPVFVVSRIHHQEVHRSHEAAGSDGWPKREHGAPDDLPPRLGDEDAG